MKYLFKLISSLIILSCFAFSAPATPVAVSSITFAAGVVTVNTAAVHSITVTEPGFCIVGSSVTADNVCGTISSVPTTTQFTFNLSSGAACAASCGTSAPGKFFLLDTITPLQSQGTLVLTFCVWTYATNGVSQVGNVSHCGAASSQENAAIAAGSIVEKVFTISFPSNWTLAKADAFATDLHISMQSALSGGVQPAAVVGKFCDVVGCN